MKADQLSKRGWVLAVLLGAFLLSSGLGCPATTAPATKAPATTEKDNREPEKIIPPPKRDPG